MPTVQRVSIGVLAVLVAVPLLATLEHPGMVWDEGYTVDRAEKVLAWFRLLFQNPDTTLLAPRSIDAHWPFAREEPDGHPPVYALLALGGFAVSGHFLPPLSAWRVGASLLWIATLLSVFFFLRHRLGLFPAAAAVLLTAWCPRLFAHAHFALYDVPLGCFWVLAVLATCKAFEARRSPAQAIAWSLATSVALAAAAATKFTGWLIPVSLLGGIWFLRGRHVAVPEHQGTNTGLLGNPWLLLFLVALPLALAAPETLRLVRQVTRLDQEVRAQAAQDHTPPRQIPAIVGHRFRRDNPSRLPGWFLFGAGPLLCAFALVRRRLRKPTGFDTFDYLYVLIGCTPLLTLCLIPSWWPDPIQRAALFLWSNMTRRETTWIPTLFLGQVYDYALPWYNTAVWCCVALPPLSLLLSVLGAFRMVDGDTPRGRLAGVFAVHASLLLVIRALPHAPGHDGIRQLVPAVLFLCLLSAPALHWLHERAISVGYAVGAVAVVWSGLATVLYHPVQLSYYSELIGGLPGATRLGFEPTYYWDAFDDPARDWITKHTNPGHGVAFSSLPLSFHYLQRWGYLPVPIAPVDPAEPQWYVLLNRPGLFAARPIDRWLATHGRAAFERTKFGVPLIWVFPFGEVDRARDAQQQSDTRLMHGEDVRQPES